MITLKKVQITQNQIDTITCDKCGKTIDPEIDGLDYQEWQRIIFVGGYNSVFGDGNLVSADICQHCLKELIGDFCRILTNNDDESYQNLLGVMNECR